MNNVFYFGDTLDNITLTDNVNNYRINEIEESCKAEIFVKSSENGNTSVKEPKISSSQFNISVNDSNFFNSWQFDCSGENKATTVPINECTKALITATLSTTTDFTSTHTENIENKEHFSQLSNTVKTGTTIHEDIIIESTPEKDSHNSNNNNDEDLNHKKYLLSSWGLPKEILEKYNQRNVTKMFPWQVQCLSNENLFKNNSNLIYSAPTSAGKTLVAEILAIKTVMERKKKVLFVLPFVSVVREKMFYLQDILGISGIRVEGFMGSYNPPGGFHSVLVAVCTIEKANSIINRLLEEGNLADIGTIIVDEIHLLADPSRGYLLELMLTKLLYMLTRFEDIKIQIIGMSATLPNLSMLGKWLKADIYTTDFRPIPLYEQWLLENQIYNKNLQLERTIEPLPELETDMDNILYLCLETIEKSCSTLIFCPTKNWCENLSQQISAAFRKLGRSNAHYGLVLRQELNSSSIQELLEQLRHCPSGLDKILERTIAFGAAFHHAGLTMDERDIIEVGFRNSTIRVLVATSTLSSGVNLPARRVIIRTPLFHGKPLDNLVYRQMIGRAGRMGKDTSGESILICQKNNCEIAKTLVSSKLMPIKSCLGKSGILTRAILEVIASGVVQTPDDVNTFSRCTLFSMSENETDDALCDPVTEAIEFLIANEFVRLQKSENEVLKYLPTALGKACLSSSMSPEDGLSIFLELEQARRCFVLDTELHLIYIVTPYSTCNQWGNLDWMLFLEMWEKLPTSMKRVGELVGISESYIINATRNKTTMNTSKTHRKLQIHKRFFTALALQDLVNEVPVIEVANKFGCSRGMLQSLQQSSSTFAGMLTTFSRQLGWSSMEILIAQFQDRLQFGVSRDLLDLMRLSLLNGPRARILYNGGIESLVHLASSDVTIIENLLYKLSPFESEKGREGECEYDVNKRNKMRTIWITGREGLTASEAAGILVKEARRYLKLELGLTEANWKQSKEEECIKMHTLVNNSNIEQNQVLELNTSIEVLFQSNSCVTQTKLHESNISRNILQLSDQNLFDTSFEMHVDANTKEESFIKNTTDNKRNSDSGLDIENESFLENAFFSKHDSKETNINNSLNFESNSQVQNDFIDCSQATLDGVISVNCISTPKRFSGLFCKKRSEENIEDTQVLISTPTKKRKTVKEDSVIETYNTPMFNDLNTLHIIDVCENEQVYETFFSELHTKSIISLSLACKKHLVPQMIIGSNVIREDLNSDNAEFLHKDVIVKGIAISWGANISYYISFENEKIVKNDKKIKMIREVFVKNNFTVIFFNCKEQLRIMKLSCGLDFEGIAEDSKIADWLLDPDGKEKNLHAMALKYAPDSTGLLQLVGQCKGVGSIGVNVHSAVKPKVRSSVESVVCWHLRDPICKALKEESTKLITTYRNEMKSLLCIIKMELNGIKVNLNQLQLLVDTLKKECENLQNKAFSHAGRRFSFTSSIEVAKILGLYRGKKISTNKQKLQNNNHPIAEYVLQWRKLNNTLIKMICPLIRLVENNRIHGYCITHTSTGRISMHEPNIQNVPRDFENISLKSTISCRSVFVASENCTFLSADYCQLELRILTHFSQDPTLCNIMKTDIDVFKLIAARWKNIEASEVDDKMRQWAKQLCYGIIYGIGTKTLAENLGVTEEEALDFMDTFKEQYSYIQIYIQKTINKCTELGYVETYTGRRRYLPNILNENSTLRSQAERQAVNTTIQGSAADLTKLAMTVIESRFHTKYRRTKNLPKLVLHLHDELLYEVHGKYLLKTAKILKQAMEESVRLSIPFPVKLKSGESWGTMKELII
ncbi:hypothetical protein FQA39_LY01568 [Lamprigera yunnana]|nr:hypothetical protein FQA39_LY01568 [Lamprigera yunnana]